MRNGLFRIAITAILLLLLPASAGASNLLGSSHGGSARWEFCYGKPDSTPLPPDPRTLVQPGVNAGKAVHFNAFWKNCHVDPVAVQEEGAAQTCGELRERFYHGGALLETGGPEVGTLFTGNDLSAPESLFGAASTFTAAQYNNLWTVWGGFLLRPDNFDELVGERYGSGFGPSANPYPLPWENPNLSNGGSGKLPEMLTQLRNPDGSWSGRIGVTCHACHSGAVGSPSSIGPGVTYGGGSSLADLHLFLNDMLPLGYPASLAVLANLTRTRGTNNASDINLAFLFPDQGFLSPDVALGVLTSGSTASMDTPAWWNMGHRPVKFVDGVFPMDAPRVDMVFYTPFLGLFGSLGGPLSEAGQDWMRAHGPALNTWAESLKAPVYPLTVSTPLAEQGAVLFHTLDLWAPGRNNPVPRPEGNGSCASCHGAYSPQYVNDPAFLDTPALEGMASYIVPLDIIGTDPVRVLTNNEAVQVAGATNFFGYPPTAGTDQDCGPQNRADLRGDRELGYLAPPLHGVWATAPYFHNGSVPNIWEVLKPSARKPLWKRVSKPARWDQKGKVIMGFDTDITRAYDAQKVGWKYDTVACQWQGYWNPMVSPYINCNPDNDEDPLMQEILAAVYSNFILTWNVLFPPVLTTQQKEDRKIYNTHMYGQGNEGHELSAVLTDNERYALIEYLKTL